nr:facilitated trehalose transporter Tret1-like [Cherax quadricarinatus]
MSTSRGLSTTLPRSESEIVVDFARPPPTSEDDMSHDSLNEVEFCLQNLPRTSRSSSKNALYVEDSEEEEEAKNPGTSKSFKSPKTTSKSANTLPVSSKSLKTSLEPLDTQGTTPDWNLHTQSESNTSRGSIKVVTDNRKTRLSRNLSGKTANSSPAYSFRSTIDLLPSCKKRRGLRQQVIVTFACCLGPLACGFAQAYNLSKDPGEFMAPQLGPWRTYVHLIGCLSGGFLSGFLANYGRKMVLMVIMVPMALSWFFVIFATQVGCLMCFMLGEILVWKSLAIVGVCLVLPVFVALVLCMPESPRFLIHVHPNHALATLQWLRGLENDVMEEYHDISDSCEMDRWSIVCSDLLRPTFWRPLMISCGLMFLYTMTGLSSVMLYGMELFGEVSSVYINVAHFIVTAILIVAITLSGPDHPLYDNSRKGELGLLKSEMCDNHISELIALKPKMYSVKIAGRSTTVSRAKGILPHFMPLLTLARYKNVLTNVDRELFTCKSISNVKGEICTVRINKRGLSAFDDKRYHLNTNESLAYGHPDILPSKRRRIE